MTPATARSHRKSSVVPRVARRVSGPVRPRAVPAPAGGATASVVTRARAAADHRLLDRLLRSRAWIWALGILLGGIVAMQVSLLKLNSGISRAVETTATLERQNGALENAIGRLGATTRIQTGAKSLGLVMPAPADVTYLRSRSSDPERALRVMTAPSDEAAALMANNGIVPGSLVAPPAEPADRDGGAGAGDHDDGPAAGHRDDGAGAGDHDDRPAAGHRDRPGRHPLVVGLVERRIGLLFAVFLTLLILGGLRAAWLGLVRADSLQTAAATQQKADIAVPARRGTITDATGTELAVSRPAATVTATPYLVKDPAKAASVLARTLKVPEDELLRKLARRDTGFVYLARHVPSRRADRARGLKIEGVDFLPEFQRDYPRTWMASQLLGNVGTDGKGLSGLEYELDRRLRGADGERKLVKDALGDAIELRDVARTRRGADVKLTLDANIQDEAEQALARVGQAWKPKGATALVMNPQDGSVLALANWPRVDANRLFDAPDYAMMNRATGVTYEPGSTFKAFTVAAAIEEGKVRPDTAFNLAPTITVADREIGESHARGYVTLTTAEILKQSSNVGAVTIGQRLGADHFDRWVRRFGFGKPTGVDLPGEESGLLLDRKDYSGSSMGNMPIGQGLSVTPMQMGAAYSAIANGGILRPPRIIDSVGGRKRPVAKGRRVISLQTAAALRRMLEGVLGPGGTASGAKIEGYVAAGKTGTAEKADEYGGYSKTKFVSSFVGFAPAHSPKLLIAVMVDEPKGDIYGGTVAAPAFKEIADFALTYLRIAPR